MKTLRDESPEPVRAATEPARLIEPWTLPLPLLRGLPTDDASVAARRERRRALMLDDESLKISLVDSRRRVRERGVAFVLASVLTAGTVGIIAAWPFCRARAARLLSVPCAPDDADVVLVTSADGSTEVCEVEAVAELALEHLTLSEARARRAACVAAGSARVHRMIVFRHTRFLLRGSAFVRLDSDEARPATNAAGGGGLTEDDAAARAALWGKNLIDVPIPPWPVLLFRECVHPFVIFQVWAVIVWVSEAYWSFSAFIFVTAIMTAVSNLFDLLRNLREIRRLSLFTTRVRVLRAPAGSALPVEIEVDSSALVPGDVLALRSPFTVPADVVLLRGNATVTEAMLTGEATVVVKSPLSPCADSDSLAAALDNAPARCTLFCGTSVVELRATAARPALAVVVRTGFECVKGRLVLSILFPKDVGFKFLEQSLKFIGVLFALAFTGFIVNAKALADFGASAAKIVQRGCDMVTIVVPPALPLAMTVGTMYALLALRRKGISCISPPKVNIAGKVNAFVFDKTGTLTTEGLELASLVPVSRTGSAGEAGAAAGGASSSGGAIVTKFLPEASPALVDHHFGVLLAACQSLTHVAGALAGDPLEVEVFSKLEATLEEDAGDVDAGKGGGREFSPRVKLRRGARTVVADIVHRFEFSSALQRMGTLVLEGEGFWSYVKGAPEVILSLCDAATVPPNFEDVLNSFTRRGLRVLAGAYKASSPAAAPTAHTTEAELDILRADAERGLTFIGFIVLENKLKPESAPTIERLHRETGMPLIMATGDNAISAIAVSRECGILPRACRVFLGDLAPPGVQLSSAASRLIDSALTPKGGCSAAEESGGVGDAAVGGGVPLTPRAQGVVWRNADGTGEMLDAETLLPLDASGGGCDDGGEPYRLALTGRAFQSLVTAGATCPISRRLLQRAICNTAVFARMAPEAKAELVVELQGMGLYVGMIGDGANDSMALRAAHCGISLSQVEASVAAPFTSAKPTIECIPVVLAEGRGALATSFCLFQFMALYSTIQFANALLVVFCNSFLSNNMCADTRGGTTRAGRPAINPPPSPHTREGIFIRTSGSFLY